MKQRFDGKAVHFLREKGKKTVHVAKNWNSCSPNISVECRNSLCHPQEEWEVVEAELMGDIPHLCRTCVKRFEDPMKAAAFRKKLLKRMEEQLNEFIKKMVTDAFKFRQTLNDEFIRAGRPVPEINEVPGILINMIEGNSRISKEKKVEASVLTSRIESIISSQTDSLAHLKSIYSELRKLK